MKIKHKLLVAATAIIAAFGINTTTVHAAKYSKTEAKQVRQFQHQYYSLSKIKYTKQNIYQQQPNFGLPFSAGFWIRHTSLTRWTTSIITVH